MVLKTRDLLVRQRTQAINALRGHLAEIGIVAAKGLAKVATLIAIVRDGNDQRLPPAARMALNLFADQIEMLTERVDTLGREIAARSGGTILTARNNPGYRADHCRNDPGAFSFGMATTVSVFIKPFEDKFGWLRAEISFAYTLLSAGAALGRLVVARPSNASTPASSWCSARSSWRPDSRRCHGAATSPPSSGSSWRAGLRALPASTRH